MHLDLIILNIKGYIKLKLLRNKADLKTGTDDEERYILTLPFFHRCVQRFSGFSILIAVTKISELNCA